MSDSGFFTRKVNETALLDALAEGATVLVEDGTGVKRYPAAKLGTVRSVNGNVPDEEGNVAVTTSWDELEGRPFGETVERVALFENFDTSTGNDTGIEIPIENGEWEYPDTVVVVYNGIEYTCEYSGNRIYPYGDSSFEQFPFVIRYKNTYRVLAKDSGAVVSAYAVQTTIKPIPEKYVPASFDEIFVAEYGVTTLDEILEAVAAGKVCFCKDGTSNNYAMLTHHEGTYADFTYCVNFQHVALIVSAYIGWSTVITNLQDEARKSDTITDEVGGRYPTVGAVIKYAVPQPTTANVGQVMVVADTFAADDSGLKRPARWEAVDLPTVPVSAAVPDAAGDTPTADEFNALLASLRAAGLLATE